MEETTWIVDRKDRIAQRVAADADSPNNDARFVKVCATSSRKAIEKAGPYRPRPLTQDEVQSIKAFVRRGVIW